MRFRVLDKDGNLVFGSDVGEGNAYIAAYPVPLKDEKHPLKLDVGEVTHVRYSLGGTVGTYTVIRDS